MDIDCQRSCRCLIDCRSAIFTFEFRFMESPDTSPLPPALPTNQAPPSQPQTSRGTSTYAITTFVLALGSIVTGLFCLLIPQLLGVIFGHMALAELKKNPQMDGKGLAIAGLIINWLLVVFVLFVIAAIIALVVMGGKMDLNPI